MKRASLAAIVAATAAVLFATSAMASSFQVLHNFSGPEGETPAAPLVQGADGFVVSDGKDPTGPLFQAGDGFFYGTTNEGGPWNAGVVYKVNVLGSFALLHGFTGDGFFPKAGVIQASDGFFYGTTEQGGYGGEIFRLDAVGNLTVVHRFDAYASDRWRPVSGLIEGRDGLLYGTAPIGGQPVTSPIR